MTAPSHFTFNRSTNWRHSVLLLIKQSMPGGYYKSTLGIRIRSLTFMIHLGVHSEFQPANVSSGMSTDQAHEQNNSLVKGPCDAIGLTENRSAFTRWMVARPELSRTLE